MGIRLGSFTSTTTGDEVLTLGISDPVVVINATINTSISAKTGKSVSKTFINDYLIYLNGKYSSITDPSVDGKQVVVFQNGKPYPLFCEDGSVNPEIVLESDKVATVDVTRYAMPE